MTGACEIHSKQTKWHKGVLRKISVYTTYIKQYHYKRLKNIYQSMVPKKIDVRKVPKLDQTSLAGIYVKENTVLESQHTE